MLAIDLLVRALAFNEPEGIHLAIAGLNATFPREKREEVE